MGAPPPPRHRADGPARGGPRRGGGAPAAGEVAYEDPLTRAALDGELAAAQGFDWPDPAGVLDKLTEELAELREAVAGGDPGAIAHELGDLLLAAVSLGRHTGVPAGHALEAANRRFERRFAAVCARAEAGGAPLAARAPEDRERLWAEVKAMEAG